MRFLTGIQPSGEIHLGNYFGAIQPALSLDGEGFFCIADYHALTSSPDPKELRENSRHMAAALMALGCTNRHYLYRQSDVPEVHELSWLLACLTGMGTLERGHAVKAAKDAGKSISVGTHLYPLLMASDILMLNVDAVPVGRDQHQHVQITELLATRVNSLAGKEILKAPKALILENVGTVSGIDGQKMSKSHNNTIPMFGYGPEIRKLVMKIQTDSTPMEEPMNPEKCTVFKLFSLLASKEEIEQMKNNYASSIYGYGHAKNDLVAKLVDYLYDVRVRYSNLLEDYSKIEKELESGSARVRMIARETIINIREVVGLD